ncbi:hydrolase [Streptomyces phaeoluteigriseus]|uniref:Hydrolase n=1 Tax=Streptomyces phaeoluteigriseus TaxID=114686 RepID=A0A1V6MI26_9ACTN|nr:phytase [Streptomyces phaeoluteigriseus]OQD51996.1 hydrolase [Streptomyces phaeoluteigriseus]
MAGSLPRTFAVSVLTASLALTAALPASAGDDDALPAVLPRVETPALYDDEAGGNSDADDPAIWRNAADPDASLVVATAKEGGLRVYDLGARLVQSLAAPAGPGPEDAPGRYNNVDVVQGLKLSTGRADLAVTTDRGNDRLRIYRIDPTSPGRPLSDVTDPAAAPVFSADQTEINEQRTAYGLATWTDRASGRTYALVSRRERTTIALLELTPTAGGKVGYRKVRTLDLPSSFRLPNGTSWSPCAEPGELPQVEGMVVDPANGTLYAGQEDIGIWRVPATLQGTPRLVDTVREYGVPGTYDEATEECVNGTDPGYGGTRIAADVEGLTLLSEADGDGYVLASSQGDDTFAAYDREQGDDNEYEGGFRVAATGTGPDGSEECDGAAVLNAPLGRRYPGGLLVVQDGHDDAGQAEDRTATNFKFVDLREVLTALDD